VREPLTVAVAQPPCAAYDVAANAAAHAAAVRAAHARVVVFPELSLTGYELDAPPVSPGDARLAPLISACAETGTLALAGAPVAGDQVTSDQAAGADGRVYIAVLAVSGAGVTVAYRKMWLGAEEARRFTPGPAPAALDVHNWRLGLAVCKDTGVPQHAADTAALGIGAYLAGTVKSAEEAALQDERARRIAIGHRVWVAVASFAGSTGGGYSRAAGRSAIWTPEGEPAARAGDGPGAIASATLTR
jgi:predicted amidohydrolase